MKQLLTVGTLLALWITACAPTLPLSGVPTEIQPLATASVGATTQLAASTPSATTSSAISTPLIEGTATLPSVVSTQATATPQASVPVTGGTTIKATLSDKHGLILADADGVAVYAFRKDSQHGTTSACIEQDCTSDWIPVMTQGAPVAGDGAIQLFLGTISRPDGIMQVTYNGWPLYYSMLDTGSGSTKGQRLNKEWFLLSPSGNMIKK
jgi:predicted lipoprotein with Yx(FWY)xxD motif